MGSFFHKIKAVFIKFFGSAPSWVQHAAMVVNYVAPLAGGIIVVLDPEDAPEATSIIQEVQKDLATAGALLTPSDAPTNVGQIKASLENVNANLKQLLTAGHIKNPATLAKVQGVANVVVGELEAVLGGLPQ